MQLLHYSRHTTLGSTPVHFSTSHDISLTTDMKIGGVQHTCEIDGHFGRSPEVLRASSPPTVVVLDYPRWCRNNRTAGAVVPNYLLGSAGRPSRSLSVLAAAEPQPATDTLSVVWLRGTFGRGAQASSAGFLHHMDGLGHVYTKVGPSGVPQPRARALWKKSSLAPVLHSSIPCQVVGSLQSIFNRKVYSSHLETVLLID